MGTHYDNSSRGQETHGLIQQVLPMRTSALVAGPPGEVLARITGVVMPVVTNSSPLPLEEERETITSAASKCPASTHRSQVACHN